MTLEELKARVGEHWDTFQSVYDVEGILADDEFELDWIDAWVRRRTDVLCARELPHILAGWAIDCIHRRDANVEAVLRLLSSQSSPNFGDILIEAIRQELDKGES